MNPNNADLHNTQTPPRPSRAPAWRNMLRSMVASFYRHPVMKLTAFVIAIIFWTVLVAADPTILRKKTFPQADVAIIGLDTLRGRGYTVTEDIVGMQLQVRMQVEVAQRDYDRVTANNFSPRLDLSKVRSTSGQQRIYFTAGSTAYGETVEFDPAYIDLNVEPYITRRIPVVVEQAGRNEHQLWVSTPHLDPSQVTVSGPVSLAKQVRRAIARLPLESLSAQRESDSVSVPLELQDETGHTIVSPLLRISNESITLDAVQIDVTVYPMREVPVDVGSAVRGLPAHGYEVGDVHLTPSSVLVAAPLDVLDRLTMLYVESPLDVENATQSQLGGSNIRYLPDLAYTSIGEVVVQVEIRQAQHTHTYDNRTIIPMNVPPEMQATLSVPYMAVVLTGNYRDLEPLEAAQIHLYVDATGLSAGTHTLAVQCRVDGLTDFQFAAQTPTVELTLQAKNPSASAGK